MIICCVIDSLGSGGAQRQMTWLIRVLVERGHEVELVTYHPFEQHFAPKIQALGVPQQQVSTPSKLERIFQVRKRIRTAKPDVIVSFLHTPNCLALVSSVGFPQIPVVVSERSLDQAYSWSNRCRFNLYRFASAIVTNCQPQHDFIAEHFPFLSDRTTTIRNCVDTKVFVPRKVPLKSLDKICIGVTASVTPLKNAKTLVRALAIARFERGIDVTVDWFGNNLFRNGEPTAESTYYLETLELASRLGISDAFRFHDPIVNVSEAIHRYDALCLPSFREGMSNSLCEAISSGVPIIASGVGENRFLVGQNERGWLIDPSDMTTIVDAIVELCRLDGERLTALRNRCREFAVTQLSPRRFGDEYEKLILNVATRTRRSLT